MVSWADGNWRERRIVWGVCRRVEDAKKEADGLGSGGGREAGGGWERDAWQ